MVYGEVYVYAGNIKYTVVWYQKHNSIYYYKDNKVHI